MIKDSIPCSHRLAVNATLNRQCKTGVNTTQICRGHLPFSEVYERKKFKSWTATETIVTGAVSQLCVSQWRTQEFFFGGGVQQIRLRTEERENGDLGAVAP